ncbi:hypothetical protein [Brevundimonas sp.]|uniref:hypothetical protein n=1 Tax=Brevundimonas sp. TaxID=1871086 RepID=UPI0028AE2848|nr:hypothetical protein [Brevundimonas sp.]
MTHPTDALRLVNPHKDITENLRQAAVDLHPWFVGDAKTFSVDCALPAYLNDAADEIERLRAAAPASPLPGGGNILWMMHVRGPDDIYPAPDYETAVAWCDYVNDVLAKRLPDVMMKAVPAVYPRTREEHAAGLPDAIKGWTLPAAPTGEPK